MHLQVVSESEEEEEENSLSDAIMKLDDSMSDANSLSPVIIEYDTDPDESEPPSIIANKKSSKINAAAKKQKSVTSTAKSTLQEEKSTESKQDSPVSKQKPSKPEQRFNISNQSVILKQNPVVTVLKCSTPEPSPTIAEQKSSPVELNDEADGEPTDEQKLEQLRSIPGLKSRIEGCNLERIKLIQHLLQGLKPEKITLVQDVLNGSSRSLSTESGNASLNEESKGEKPSAVSSTTPSLPVRCSDESVVPTPSGSASEPLEPEIDLAEGSINATSSSSRKKSKLPSKSRKAGPKSRKTSSKLRKASPELTKVPAKSPKSSPIKMPPPKKRKRNELDRLHADIEKMRGTKNNIFRAVGPRACRKGIPMYNDDGQKVKTTVVLPRDLVPKVPGEGSSSSSDEEVFRPTKNPAKKTKTPFSYNFSSDDSKPNSSDDEGSPVTRFKQIRRRSSSSVKSSRSSSCRSNRRSRSRSKSYKHVKRDSSSSSCSEVETKRQTKNCLSDAEKCGSKLMDASRKKHGIVEEPKPVGGTVPNKVLDWTRLPKLKICVPRLRDSDYQEYLKKQPLLDSEATYTSNEDTFDSSFSEYDCSFSYNINEEFPTNSTDTAKKQPLTLKLKKKKPTQKKTATLFPKKKKQTVLSAIDRIELLPKRNWFKDGGSFLQHDPIIIRLRPNQSRGHELLYECSPGACPLEFNSVDATSFAQHLSFAHGQVEWNGRCELCNKINSKSDLIDAFAHLLAEHLTFVDKSPPALTSPQKPATNSVSPPKRNIISRNSRKTTTSSVSEDDSVSSLPKNRSSKNSSVSEDDSISTQPKTSDAPQKTQPAIQKTDSVSKPLETKAASSLSRNTSPVIYEDNLVSRSTDAMGVEKHSKHIPIKVPDGDSNLTPNDEVSVKESVKEISTSMSENSSVLHQEEIAAKEPVQNTLTITRIETVQVKPQAKRAVAKKRITGSISRKSILAKQLLHRTSTPEPTDNVPAIESVVPELSISTGKISPIPALRTSNDIISAIKRV